MSQLTIKQFAQDHEILVEDVCSRDIYYVEATTPVQEVRSIAEDTTVDWIFTTSNGHIIGAVARSTVYDALQYSDEPFNVGNLVEYIPDIAHAKDTLLSYEQNASELPPLRIVHNTAGETIGVLDKRAWDRSQTRHMLTREDQEELLSNPIIKQISIVANNLGVEVYIIGGWVRDFLLDLPSKDLDFAVVGNAFHLATELATQFGGEVHQFNDFGGAHWVVSDTLTIDFTGTRSEKYATLGSLPVVAPTHIDRDLRRRDFSINAMAIAVHMNKLGLLLDPMNGLLDLQRSELRTLHGLSFLQDPTRIFRAARYTTRFKMNLHPGTQVQMQRAIQTIQIGDMLTLTRIGIELEKIFDEPQPKLCWQKLNDWNIWAIWQPSWSSLMLHSASHLSYKFDTADWKNCWWMQLRLALSGENAGVWKDVISIRQNGLKDWTQFPRQFSSMQASLQTVQAHHSDWKRHVGDALAKSTPAHWLLLEFSNPNCARHLDWWIATGIHRNRSTSGVDILQMGIPKGPKVAELLQIAQYVAWEGGEKAEELSAIRAHIAKSESHEK